MVEAFSEVGVQCQAAARSGAVRSIFDRPATLIVQREAAGGAVGIRLDLAA